MNEYENKITQLTNEIQMKDNELEEMKKKNDNINKIIEDNKDQMKQIQSQYSQQLIDSQVYIYYLLFIYYRNK